MGFILLFGLLMPLFIFILWFGCLISCISNNNLEGDRRILWFVVVFFIPFFGSILYLLLAPRKPSSSVPVAVSYQPNSQISAPATQPHVQTEGVSLLRVLLAVPVVCLVLVIGIPLLASSKSKSSLSSRLEPTESTRKSMTSNLRNALVAQEAYLVDHDKYLVCKNARCGELPGYKLDENFGIEFEMKGNQLVASSWIKGNIAQRVSWSEQKGFHDFTF